MDGIGEVCKSLELEEICSEAGLLIVPISELERFYPQVTSHGPKWVNEVLETVDLKEDKNLRDAREFVEKIVSH